MNGDSISYSDQLTDEQVDQAAGLIDSERPLESVPSRRERLMQAPFKVAAINVQGDVVGIAAIKKIEGVAGEIGFLTVRNDFRGKGIALSLMRRRVDFARAAGLALLYANARASNVASKNLLVRSGYTYFGSFLSSWGSKKKISWYFLPLDEDCDADLVLQSIVDKLGLTAS